jgi:hypothetical protein
MLQYLYINITNKEKFDLVPPNVVCYGHNEVYILTEKRHMGQTHIS